MTQSKVMLALTAWKWLATDLNNTEAQPPLIIDDPDSRKSDALCVGDALIPFDARRFAPSVLHKKVFGKMLKAEVDEILNLLQSVGVVGVSCREDATGGRPRELRHIAAEWLCADNLSAFARLETKLTEMLTKALDARQVDDHEQSTQAAAEIALKVYDFLCDPENTEIDNQNAQVFSIKRLCREVGEGVAEGLEILERHRIISGQYKEPNARGRIIARLNQDWFKIGGRERLVKLLIPPKPEPYKQVGPLRALETFFFLHQGRSQTISGGMIIADEQLCRLLIAGDYPVVSLDDFDTRICASTSCRHRFKLSDSATLDHPALLVLQDFFFKFNNILIDYKRGDIISRRDFFEFLTKGNAEWPVIPAAESEYTICPRCKHASRRTALLAENR